MFETLQQQKMYSHLRKQATYLKCQIEHQHQMPGCLILID
uniref:Uncharacterized protein MANES_09G004500 n=1 Tax=Rhizophora mucronata TaxID=61149 RepID=A0A2P2QRN9_RHIMU